MKIYCQALPLDMIQVHHLNLQPETLFYINNQCYSQLIAESDGTLYIHRRWEDTDSESTAGVYIFPFSVEQK